MKVSKAFIAKYPGTCPKCNQRWHRNVDWLNYVDNVLCHVKCPANGQGALGTSVKGDKYRVDPGEAYQPGIVHQYGVNEPLPIETNPIVDTDALSSLIDTLNLSEDEENILRDELEPKEGKPQFVPSKYQQAIFDFISNGNGHAVVEAVAGSGKTTTIVKALDLTPKDAKVAFVAFNKHIATELKKRAPDHVHVSTLHSLGLSIIRKVNPKIEINDDKVNDLLEPIYPVTKHALNSGLITKSQRKDNFTKRLAMRKLVSICKSTLVDVKDANAVLEVIERYGIEIDDKFTDELINLLPDVIQKCMDNIGIVDFDDMIWLPLVTKMDLDKFDYLFVDEAQDMNKSQIEFILGSIKDTGRIIAVGDRNQSLYGFRGADTNAIQNIIDSLRAVVLPLSVTYRCPSSHVEMARKIVPQLEPKDNAAIGSITNMDYFDLAKSVQPGDMVICRTNAPLIKPAFECIRMGKKAMIRGKDIGASLINLIKRFETNDLGSFEVMLSEYFEHEYNKYLDKGKEMQALLLQDRVETLRFICNECSTVAELMSKIEMLFSDNNQGVVFSSIHRAKGLEADNVYILRSDLMPHPKATKEWETQQEMNAVYVAQTRSKDNLIFVKGGENV